MKKLIFALLILASNICLGQYRTLSGFDPSTGRPGYKYVDTLISLPYLPLYYINGYGNVVSFKTDSVPEGTKLYYTDARARAAITVQYGSTGQTSVATGDLLYGSAVNTWSKLSAGTNGHILTLSGGLPTWAAASGGGGITSGTYAAMVATYPADGTIYSCTDYLPGGYQYSSWDSTWRYLINPDFIASATVSPYLTATATGTGASVSNTAGYITSYNSRYGGYRYFQTGTTATGSAIATFGAVGNLYYTDTVKAAFVCRMMVPQVSSGTDRFVVTVGKGLSSGASTSGLFFRYCDSLSSGNWEAVSVAAGTYTTTNTGVAIKTDRMQDFAIVTKYTATGPALSHKNYLTYYYIDKILVATHTTNYVASTTSIFDGFGIYKTAGTTNKSIFYSHVKLYVYGKD